jgi:hypothetical protein
LVGSNLPFNLQRWENKLSGRKKVLSFAEDKLLMCHGKSIKKTKCK